MAAPRRKRPSSTADEERLPARRGKGVESPNASCAALIAAFNQQNQIAATVRAALAIPQVDLVLVVDDGSTDATRERAQVAGATTVRHSHHRGRAAALETGVAVIGMRDEPDHPERHILILDGGLGDYAVGAAPLVPPVVHGVADLAIALADSVPGGRSTGMAAALARNAIERASGWAPDQPLSRTRCIRREALEAALPLSRGAGLEPGMTLDVLLAGYTATELDCEIRVAPRRSQSPTMRASRYRDVMAAISTRRIRGGIEATGSAVADRILLRRDEEDDQ